MATQITNWLGLSSIAQPLGSTKTSVILPAPNPIATSPIAANPIVVPPQYLFTLTGNTGANRITGGNSSDRINGLAGNDALMGGLGNDELTGGGDSDTFMIRAGDGTDRITDFGGVGTGVNPTAATIANADVIQFQGAGLTARNLLLTQQGNDLVLSFEGVRQTQVILQNFKLENLDNLQTSTGAAVNLGNIRFDGQSQIQDSFDVFDANSMLNRIFNRNSVTFLNDLSNTVGGFDRSDDVINGMGGNDQILSLSGDDLLRGGQETDTGMQVSSIGVNSFVSV